MASTRRKSAAIALAVIGIAGLSLAAAAQLNITNTTLQAGVSLTAACDANGLVAMQYGYAYSSTAIPKAYALNSVAITGVDSACNGKTIEATLVPASGAAVTLTGQAITGTTGDVTVTWTGTTGPAALPATATIGAIDTVAVVIHS